jgi:hypothetical protein
MPTTVHGARTSLDFTVQLARAASSTRDRLTFDQRRVRAIAAAFIATG